MQIAGKIQNLKFACRRSHVVKFGFRIKTVLLANEFQIRSLLRIKKVMVSHKSLN